jgi:RES domain-containing protein
LDKLCGAHEAAFFRSVEYRYMDPLDVLSGSGTWAHGGRFAPVGTRAVYLSVTDSGASKEVTGRKSRLGGIGQISTDKYPRVVYAVAEDLKKALSLTTLGLSQAAEAVKTAYLDKDDLNISMVLAGELITAGIEGLLFPSVVGGDDNLEQPQPADGGSVSPFGAHQMLLDSQICLRDPIRCGASCASCR